MLVLRLDLADAFDPCLIEDARLVFALDFFYEALAEARPAWFTGNTQLAKQALRCFLRSLLFIAASACFAKEEKFLGEQF
jgi:hypothetical protein